jgi:transposase InsO family protein
MKFRFIRAQSGQHKTIGLCLALGVSRGGYYGWLSREESLRIRQDRLLLAQIRAVYQQSRHRYGSPRIHAELSGDGVACGRHRIARLMRQDHLVARAKRRFKTTTQACPVNPVAPNELQRKFQVTKPDAFWNGDITYVWTAEGWLYLAVLIDLFSRRIVGWATSDRLTEQLALSALEQALVQRRPEPGLLHHSDRGSQYSSRMYRQELAVRGIAVSMSRRGNCWDNAPAESFFSSLKTELFAGEPVPPTRDAARQALFEYIEVFYNRKRRHSTLGYMSPVRFEENWRLLDA